MSQKSFNAQDYADIVHLFSRYAWALDMADLKTLETLFTPDGIMQDTAGNRYNDRDAMLGYIRTLTRTPEFRGRQHNIYNILVTGGGTDRYQTKSYWTVAKWDAPSNERRIDSTGHSEDLFVKLNGQWLFKERILYRWLSNNGPWVGA